MKLFCTFENKDSTSEITSELHSGQVSLIPTLKCFYLQDVSFILNGYK